MSDWSSYALRDFIPFAPDVYFRLLARMGESFWPMQLFTLAAGFVALILALRGRGRPALALLAPLWVFVAIAYFEQRYANLNWIGHYLCWAWLLQGGALLVLALTGSNSRPAAAPGVATTGVLIALVGLLGFPLLVPVLGIGWQQAEVFGLHPDPTAVATLGLLLIVLRGWVQWLACAIPMLWIILSAFTLQVLEAPWYTALFAVLAAAIGGLIGGAWPVTLRNQA